MWHTTELVKIFEGINDGYGYDIYKNRKLCVALCNDLLADYEVEKNIMQMLFQAGLGEAMNGYYTRCVRIIIKETLLYGLELGQLLLFAYLD